MNFPIFLVFKSDPDHQKTSVRCFKFNPASVGHPVHFCNYVLALSVNKD